MKALNVGIVGTGYAAKKRAEALQQDSRANLLCIAGNNDQKMQELADTYSIEVLDSWNSLVNDPRLDLIIVCTINQAHGAIALAALQSNKHVIVEYPLALDYSEAAKIIALAKSKQKLLNRLRYSRLHSC